MELLKKLRINIDRPLWIINATADNCLSLFEPCTIKQKLAGNNPVGQIVLFVVDAKALAGYLPLLENYIAHDTLFWICYPKKSGAISSDLILMKTWDIVFKSGYRGQASISVNQDWSGMRFTNAPKKVATICDVPMQERKVEGIDFINRTAILPTDAFAVVNKYKGMAAFFNAMSFTHKKEYVIALTETKKKETRIRRIEKMVETLQLEMNAKIPAR